MAQVTYIGSDDPTDNHETTVFGLTFTRDVAVELADVPAKLRSNPTFTVEDGDIPADAPAPRGRRRAAESDAD